MSLRCRNELVRSAAVFVDVTQANNEVQSSSSNTVENLGSVAAVSKAGELHAESAGQSSENVMTALSYY